MNKIEINLIRVMADQDVGVEYELVTEKGSGEYSNYAIRSSFA